MPAPGNARGERMQHGYAPEGGKRITAHHCRVAKGVNGIIILLPFLGECWLRTVPKALPWADLSLAFLSLLCFESEQARAQAVFTPTVNIPLPKGGGQGTSTYTFRRICYTPAWSMRIYYPINKEEPTPALPKGGSLNEAQYSLTSHRLSLPSLGEGLGVGVISGGCSAGYCGLKILIFDSGG